MYVRCGTVDNSKDLKPTQMLIGDRVYKENVVHVKSTLSELSFQYLKDKKHQQKVFRIDF